MIMSTTQHSERRRSPFFRLDHFGQQGQMPRNDLSIREQVVDCSADESFLISVNRFRRCGKLTIPSTCLNLLMISIDLRDEMPPPRRMIAMVSGRFALPWSEQCRSIAANTCRSVRSGVAFRITRTTSGLNKGIRPALTNEDFPQPVGPEITPTRCSSGASSRFATQHHHWLRLVGRPSRSRVPGRSSRKK